MGAHERQVIDGIRREYGTEKDGQLVLSRAGEMLSNTLDIVAFQINSGLAHFLHEFIQNADDSLYSPGLSPSIEFQLIGQHLLVTKNETGFTKTNVDRICSAGKSDKTDNENATGEKGIGFKSVFKAATKVVIDSNGYYFSFDKRRELGILIPEHGGWPHNLDHLRNKRATQFLVELENDAVVQKMRHDLQAVLNPDILLFLRQLQIITVDIDGTKRSMSRTLTDAGKLRRLSIHSQTTGKTTSSDYFYFSKKVDVSPIKDIRLSKLAKSTAEVCLALPQSAFKSRPQSKRYHAYSRLPIRESGLPFPCQADFRLVASREDLETDGVMGKRNKELRAGVADLFLDAITQIVDVPSLRYTWLNLLPLANVGKSFSQIAGAIKSSLPQRLIFFGQNEHQKLPSNKVVFVPNNMRFEGAPILPNIVHEHHDLSLSYDMTHELRHWLVINVVSEKTFLDRLQHAVTRENGAWFRNKSMEWHESLAGILLSYMRNNATKTLLKSLTLIPLADGNWACAAPHIFFPPTGKLDAASEMLLKSFGNIVFVSQVAQHGNRGGLISNLDIEIVSDATIYAEIERLHKSDQPPTTDGGILLEHAIYLWKHRYLKHSFGELSLWVVTSGLQVVRSSSIYIDDEKQTFRCLGIAEDRILHPNYRKLGPQQDPESWLTWLNVTAGLSNVLQVVVDGMISKDFQEVSKHLTSTEWLPILLDSWDQVENGREYVSRGRRYRKPAANVLRSTADDYNIRDIQVQTRSGATARLCETYLPTPELVKIDDAKIKYLEVKDIAKQHAQRLDVALKVLRGMKRRGKPDLGALRTLYEDIQGHMKDPQVSKQDVTEAHSVFKNEAHIWEPASGSWKGGADFVWSTDFKLDFKISLAKLYPSCHTLFVQMLQTGDADLGTVLTDIAARPVPKDESDALRMIQLLTKMSEWVGTQGRESTLAKLRALAKSKSPDLKVPLVPVKLGNDPTRFIGLGHTASLLVCDRKAWEGAFPDLDVVACSALQSLPIAPLFEKVSEAFGISDHMMSNRVLEEFNVGHGASADDAMTSDLRQKMVFVKRVIESNIAGLTTEQKAKLAVIEMIQVFCAPNMTVTPYLTDTASGKRRNGTPRHGGQFLPPGIHKKGRMEIYADQSRLSRGAPFTNQLHKDLIQWLSITHDQTVDQIRDILASDGYGQIVEDLTLAGFQVQDLIVAKNPDPCTLEAAETSSVISTNGTTALPVRSAVIVNGSSQHQLGLSASDLEAGAVRIQSGSMGGTYASETATTTMNGVTRDIEIQTGIDGEKLIAVRLLRMYKICPDISMENFALSDAGVEFLQRVWTSELRHLVSPLLTEWTPQGKKVHADFTLKGNNSNLRRFLNDKVPGNHNEWTDTTTFHIEVKATGGAATNEFHLSGLQVELARDISNKTAGQEAYLIFHVSRMRASANGEKAKLNVMADPWKQFVNDQVDIRTPEGWLERMASIPIGNTTLLLFTLGRTGDDIHIDEPKARGIVPHHGPTAGFQQLLRQRSNGDAKPTELLKQHFCFAVETVEQVRAWESRLGEFTSNAEGMEEHGDDEDERVKVKSWRRWIGRGVEGVCTLRIWMGMWVRLRQGESGRIGDGGCDAV
ncbi:uncharacterized protein AB675_898 [Cyphellophora attinorum]|uniref:Protein NO VEIN C-terminal domain-containing protein n=1 Tax=Cyphellophora attinorum TaxID=1664694 RepID=A0A0N1P3J4_9EURO|nr:uncharacterized protein AB675_898 [Phialophora attinorum]KPI45525.1 hypothetical protein AB675_898 [Phialophora attinorum]